jgi:multimeric flavodoxin WrbA
MADAVTLLLVSGSLRDGSTNTALLRTAQAVVPAGIETVLYGGMGELPHFNPDDDAEGLPVHPAVAALRASVHAADALLLSTPEYAGALPGSFKNLLEWTVGDASTYRKPIAWVNTSGSAAPTGAAWGPPFVGGGPPPPPPTRTTRCARCSATSTPRSSRRRAHGSRSRAARSARTA